MFYISASAIRNYIDCKNRYYFSNYLKVKKPMTIPMVLGIGIHKAIEKNEDNDLKGMSNTFQTEFLTLLESNKIQTHPLVKVVNTSKNLSIGRAKLKAYHEIAKDLESLTYPKEYEFKVKLDRDIILVGRIDQIRGDSIYDIKTGEYPPSEELIKKDLQFTIYAYAYESLIGKKPEGLYWFLLAHEEKKRAKTIEGNAQIVEMRSRSKEDFDEMEHIIRSVVSDIKARKFYGGYGYQCRTCTVKEFCIE